MLPGMLTRLLLSHTTAPEFSQVASRCIQESFRRGQEGVKQKLNILIDEDPCTIERRFHRRGCQCCKSAGCVQACTWPGHCPGKYPYCPEDRRVVLPGGRLYANGFCCRILMN